MFAMHIISLFIIALVFAISWVIRIVTDKSTSKQPSQPKQMQTPQLWDIFGIRKAFQISRAVLEGNTVLYVDMLLDQYGDTYTMNILGTKLTFTRDAANIKSMFKDQFNDYDAAKGIRIKMFEYLAPGTISVTEGKEWKENRLKWRHYVKSLDQVLDIALMESAFQNLVHHIPKGEAIDIQPLFVAFTTDIIHEIAFGESTHCNDPQNQSYETEKYIETVKKAAVATTRRGILGPLSNFIFERGYKADCTAVKDYVGRFIQKKLLEKQDPEDSNKTGSLQRKTFLDRMLLFDRNPITLNHEATSMVLASEPVSSPLHSTIWLLSRDSLVYEKLRNSVLGMIGYEKPSFEQLNKFTYLKNVLYESLRLLPPEPLTIRMANTDTCLPKGGGKDQQDSLLIRKGQRIILSLIGSHRNPTHFGVDASEFRPSRWDDINVNTPGYVPFSIGPRACTGQQLAMTMATYTLVRFVQTYSSIESRDSTAYVASLRFSLKNRNGVWVSMIPDPQAIKKFLPPRESQPKQSDLEKPF